MAKKTGKTLEKKDSKNFAKVIKSIKSPKTGAYTFKEEFVTLDQVKKVLAD